MNSLTAIIITKNEATDLPECLASLDLVDEVVVVDSCSSDDTATLAKNAGAKVFMFGDWPGFGAQKQRALDFARGDWVLSIDADERLSAGLSDAIEGVIASSLNLPPDGFKVLRHNYFLGKRLRFGGWGNDFVVRLAKRSKCKFDLAPVHERLLVEGAVGRLDEPLLHFSYASKAEILEKRYRYAKVGAERLFLAGKSCSGISEALARASWAFFKHSLLQMGLLDGPIGIYAAYCKAAETYLKYYHLSKKVKR